MFDFLNHKPDRDEVLAEHLHHIFLALGYLRRKQELHMIDTAKILAAVTAANTRDEALLALASGQADTLRQLSDQLKAANDANDAAAQQKVQQDLDKAANDLDAEGAKVQAAIDANTPLTAQPEPAPAPASEAPPEGVPPAQG